MTAPRAGDADQQRQREQRRRDRRVLVIVAVVLVLLVVAGGIGYQAWTNRGPSGGPDRAATLTPVSVVDGEPIRLGAAEARSLTVFVDFHCPACADFEDEFGPAIFEAAGRGAVAVDIYPMAFIDSGSAAAANGFACAAEAGFGSAYYRGLFANADLDWSDEQLIELAGLVSAEVPPSFAGCVTGHSHADWVSSIGAAAEQAGVDGTPTVWLDGDPVDLTATTPDMLRAMIDEALAR